MTYLLSVISLISAMTALLITLAPIVINATEPEESNLVVLHTEYLQAFRIFDLYIENKGKKADGLFRASLSYNSATEDSIKNELENLSLEFNVPVNIENKDITLSGRVSENLIKSGEVVKTSVKLRGYQGHGSTASFQSKDQITRRISNAKKKSYNIYLTGIYELNLEAVSGKEIIYKLYGSKIKGR